MKNSRKTEVLTWVIVAMLSTAETSAEAQGRGTHHVIRWQAADGESVTSLFFTEVLSDGMVSRVLFDAPGDERLIVTDWIEASEGSMRLMLDHPPSEWWLVLEVGFGIEADSPKEFFNRAYDVIEAKDARLELSLRSSEGLETAASVPVEGRWITTTLRAFAQDLESKGVGRALGESLPDGLTAALRFLDAELSMGRPGEGLRTWVEFLRPLVPELDGPRESRTWEREDSDVISGLVVTDPKLVKVLKQFPDIDPAHPTEITR